MKRITIISIIFSVLSCTGMIDKDVTAGGNQETPDTRPVCVFNFVDTKNNPLEVTEVVVISEALEKSPVVVTLDSPSKVVSMDLIPKVNSIATYHFFVTCSTGKAYHSSKELYVPNGRRYEKEVVLARGEQTLITDRSSWKVTQVRNGLVWYNFEGYEPISQAKQVINVLELDLDCEDLKLEFLYYPDRLKISEVANMDAKLVAITNASFGSGFTSGSPVDNTFIRVGGKTYKDIGLDPSDSNYGKHEAAVWYDGVSEVGFIDLPGDYEYAREYYKSTTYPNLFSSVPMLIKNFQKTYLSSYKKKLSSTTLDPRTVLAVTCDRKLLLVTVDGRWADKANGMTYKNIQDFLMVHFYPKYAINMDGGGSTSMFVRGKNVVNYPCEGVSGSSYKVYNGTFKERGLVTYFGIREK